MGGIEGKNDKSDDNNACYNNDSNNMAEADFRFGFHLCTSLGTFSLHS
jgi:hypothetical protein